MVERGPEKAGVAGSTPVLASSVMRSVGHGDPRGFREHHHTQTFSGGFSPIFRAFLRSISVRSRLDLLPARGLRTGSYTREKSPAGRAVSRVLFPVGLGRAEGRRPFLWTCRYRHALPIGKQPTCDAPLRDGPDRPVVTTWPCTRWGLPCRRCRHRRGALLPHHFTLTRVAGGMVSVALSRADTLRRAGGVTGRWALPTTVVRRCSDFPPRPAGPERPSARPANV